ncbi:MAG: helix-turn-helix transcriptional regulator [Alistipes senegalensis]|nr:helix-turn-helix transcriptional regulator [Oxalobacter formigenes]MCM1281918.1 helix-turn-helix transcriptional regulator [Alistipes senegalensis]
MSKNIAVRLGMNIAAARKTAGKTQAEIAEKAGIDTVTLSRIERGTVAPNIATLDSIANALGLPLGILLDGASSSPSSIAVHIAAILGTLDEKNRLFVLDQIQALVKWLRNIS